MILHLLFTAFFLSLILTGIFAYRAIAEGNRATLMFALFMLDFTLMLGRMNWISHFQTELNPLCLPMWYSIGPVFYYFVQFSFEPQTNSKRWLLWFLPSALEIGLSLTYWCCFYFNFGNINTIEDIFFAFGNWSFPYFCTFFVASVVFLVRKKTLISFNILYQNPICFPTPFTSASTAANKRSGL